MLLRRVPPRPVFSPVPASFTPRIAPPVTIFDALAFFHPWWWAVAFLPSKERVPRERGPPRRQPRLLRSPLLAKAHPARLFSISSRYRARPTPSSSLPTRCLSPDRSPSLRRTFSSLLLMPNGRWSDLSTSDGQIGRGGGPSVLCSPPRSPHVPGPPAFLILTPLLISPAITCDVFGFSPPGCPPRLPPPPQAPESAGPSFNGPRASHGVS